VLVFAQEEIQLIDTVNRAILRNLRSTHTGKGRIEVYNVNYLVADSARWNFIWSFAAMSNLVPVDGSEMSLAGISRPAE
jgi:hypothetical protein